MWWEHAEFFLSFWTIMHSGQYVCDLILNWKCKIGLSTVSSNWILPLVIRAFHFAVAFRSSSHYVTDTMLLAKGYGHARTSKTLSPWINSSLRRFLWDWIQIEMNSNSKLFGRATIRAIRSLWSTFGWPEFLRLMSRSLVAGWTLTSSSFERSRSKSATSISDLCSTGLVCNTEYFDFNSRKN